MKEAEVGRFAWVLHMGPCNHKVLKGGGKKVEEEGGEVRMEARGWSGRKGSGDQGMWVTCRS